MHNTDQDEFQFGEAILIILLPACFLPEALLKLQDFLLPFA